MTFNERVQASSAERFNAETRASIDKLDQETLEEAQARVGAILAPKGPVEVPEVQKPLRKSRSDKGVPKGPKTPNLGTADENQVVLHLSLADARQIPVNLPAHLFWIAGSIQDQIISQLQKRIDTLIRSK